MIRTSFCGVIRLLELMKSWGRWRSLESIWKWSTNRPLRQSRHVHFSHLPCFCSVFVLCNPLFLSSVSILLIQSPDGDAIDCVRIDKQPAFDHPQLIGQQPLVRKQYKNLNIQIQYNLTQLHLTFFYINLTKGTTGVAYGASLTGQRIGGLSAVENHRRVMSGRYCPNKENYRRWYIESKLNWHIW